MKNLLEKLISIIFAIFIFFAPIILPILSIKINSIVLLVIAFIYSILYIFSNISKKIWLMIFYFIAALLLKNNSNLSLMQIISIFPLFDFLYILLGIISTSFYNLLFKKAER